METKSIENKAILLVSSAYGKYIPQTFLEWYLDNSSFNFNNVSKEYIDDCMNPESEYYYDSFDMICQNVEIKIDGIEYSIIPNEDLWMIPTDTNEDELEAWII